jgi:hypothetical protein
MIWSPITNPDRVLDGSMDHPRICPAIGWYMFPKKSSKLINKNNKLRKKSLKTNYHELLSLIIHELLHHFLKVIILDVSFYKKKKTLSVLVCV